MTKTGARARSLDRALVEAGFARASAPPPPRLPDLAASVSAEVRDLYQQLGGVLHEPLLRPGTWDLPYVDVIVELDEDMHFNRYRAVTLDAGFAADLPWAAPYRLHAAEHEHRSGTGGRRWTNPSAERMFGPAGARFDFDGGGAPRWKQRALYDAMKDAAAASGSVRLARVSVYDHVAGVRVEDFLRGRARLAPDALREFVDGRTSSPLG